MVPTGRITEERLNRWMDKLAAEDATPLILVAVGHNRNSGKLVVCTVEDVPDDQLALYLRGAAKELDRR
jgi:hypothetical protein